MNESTGKDVTGVSRVVDDMIRDGSHRYDLVYTNDDELLPDDIFDLWFEEVKKTIM